MRKSPIIRAVGGAAITFGLVIAAAPFASADSGSETTAGSVGQLGAMQRDLGLSATEATALLDQEEQARTLEGELRETLGGDFGGAVFDIESGELTVSVTDEDAVDEVREAGAEAEVVTYGEQRLDAIVDDLNATEDTADESVTGWYVDTADDSVVVTVMEGEEAAAEKLIATADVEGTAVRVEETTEQPETFADIIGGNAYYPGSSRCSIGFAVQGGFVTAGHCGSTGTRTSSPSGTVAGSWFPGRDMGWVRTGSGDTPRPWVNNYRGGYVTVAGSQEAGIGSSVCRSGSTTGWHCGTIQSKNQTVRYSQGSVYGLTRTSACAEPGDSGGSWVTGNQAQGVTSGGSGNCTWGGTTYFQPVNPILSQYGLRLVTG
ncbi:streptogrisin C [Spinactinospora alkalitolerans]|uniref:Streptogrisin C n=1 Tax=Spinactinospora alkalitolerans TaxID=687207 RepID=A0A852TSI2_9ACTN|nr:S1 family peptidase [Spinactinospora alkalitolerans]NYE45693.1 streptogrisin C [Spinactinospora alkalitolerans]